MMEESLRGILREIRILGDSGRRRELTVALRSIMGNRRELFHLSESEDLLDEYADALYKMLLLEIDEEEEESIEIAELAYLGIGAVLKGEESRRAEFYKRRLLLLHYFYDYFTDAVIEVFLTRYRDENRLQARNLAIECLKKMQLSDLYYLEENEPELVDNDEQINDVCNAIESGGELSESERAEAALLHKVLYAYLNVKYKADSPKKVF